jgi:hypothetical protein
MFIANKECSFAFLTRSLVNVCSRTRIGNGGSAAASGTGSDWWCRQDN